MSQLTTKQIDKALAVLELLETTTRKTEKEKLLSKHKTNPALQAIIKMALGGEKYYVHIDPDVGLCTSRFSKKKAWKKFITLTDLLKTRELGGKKGKAAVTNLFLCSDPLMVKWLHRIMSHDLRCGLGKKTVSSVYGKQWLVQGSLEGDGSYKHSFKWRQCSAARPLHKLPKKHQNLPFPVAGEFKLDGERSLNFCWPGDGDVQIVSRKPLHKPELEQLDPLTSQIVKVTKKVGDSRTPIFLDGEFLSTNWNETSSVVSSTKNFNPEKFLNDTVIILFDWAPIAAYEQGQFAMPWQKRKHHLLSSLAKDLDPENIHPGLYKTRYKNVMVLGHTIIHNEEELVAFYDLALQYKFEGIMTKTLDGAAIYDEKRGPEMVKHKPEEELTGSIVKCVAGKDKKHGPSDPRLVKKAGRFMAKYGTIRDDGYYIKVVVPEDQDGKELESTLKVLVKDAVDDRVWYNQKKNLLTYRYSARLRHFVVKCNSKTFHVGTGIKHKNGSDIRMKLWRKRKKLIGAKVDFKHQPDPNPVAVMRFNSFVRLREDL